MHMKPIITHAGSGSDPEPECVRPSMEDEEGSIPSGASSASEQDQTMDSSDGELELCNTMDVVTSNDSLQDIPIGNLGLPESGPFKLGPFELGPFELGPSGLGPFGLALLAPLL